MIPLYFQLRAINHENVNAFCGVFSNTYKQGFLFDFAKRGSLMDVLLQSENKIALDWHFKQALVRDLVNVSADMNRRYRVI